MIRITISDDLKAIERQMESLPERLELARRALGRHMASRLTKEVRDAIPSGGGWLDLYRDSIQLVEMSDGEFGVRGIAEVPFSKLEAEQTLLWFLSGDEAAQILSQYNPWTIDAVPAVKGSIFADVIVRPASSSEVNHHRQRLSGSLSSILTLLDRVGVAVEPNEFPSINGKVYADMDFMSRRLEAGLGGFPRVPHWGPAAGLADKIANSPDARKLVDGILKDGDEPA